MEEEAEKKSTYATKKILESKLRSDINKSVIMGSAGTKSERRFRCTDAENEPLIPIGSKISFEPVTAGNLKKGNFILIRRGNDLKIRRFLTYRHAPGKLLVEFSNLSGEIEEPLPHAAVVGRVIKVDTGKRTFNPSAFNFMDWLTDYGTKSPLAKIGSMFRVIFPSSD